MPTANRVPDEHSQRPQRYVVGIRFMRSSIASIALIYPVSSIATVSPIDDTLAFVTDQIAALKTLLMSVRNEADARDIVNMIMQVDSRAAYINSMVRVQIEARRTADVDGSNDGCLEGVKYDIELKAVLEKGSIQ